MNKAMEDKLLAELGVFTTDDLQVFKEFNIDTVGQLLGATKGLANKSLFDSIPEGEEKMHHFIILVPFEIIKKYREFSADFPMGMLDEEENEEDE